MRDDEPDYPALLLINHILGGSASSRLLNRLRQKDGLSYGAFSQINARPHDRLGLFFAGAICAPQNADKAMTAMLEEIDKLLREEVPAAELTDAKRSYAASWDNRIAEDDFVADELAQGLYLDRSFEHWRKINDKVQNLTAAEVRAVARQVPQAREAGARARGRSRRKIILSADAVIMSVTALAAAGSNVASFTGRVPSR